LCNAVPDSRAPPQAKLRIARVDMTLSDTTRRITSVPSSEQAAPAVASAWQRRLAVPYRSQKVERREIRGRICSPTSVSMVLAYRGIDRPTEEVSGVIYDASNGIYGNWPLAVQGAYRYGIPGYLDRFGRWADVERCIAAGQPLVISIEAAEGELRGAPYRRSNGHLLVLAGFDADGNVLVNDPAAGDAESGLLTYHRSDLERVWWEARGGTAYVLLPRPQREPVAARADVAADPIVEVADIDPRIVIDLRYATSDNFTNQVLYPSDMRCQLRESVARRLSRVQDRLVAAGLGLKIYDGLRPLAVQRTMWEIMPDPRYVADPAKGSRHNRGAAVDVTLVDLDGNELEMPTAYDDFTEAAHRDFAGCTEAAARHRALLEEAMFAEGFTGLATEWWHFDAPNWREYPLVNAMTAATVSTE
jgi:D-alanyl-D-alanine dipeptidase